METRSLILYMQKASSKPYVLYAVLVLFSKKISLCYLIRQNVLCFLVIVSQLIGLVYSQNASAINVLNFTFLDHSVTQK